MYYNAVIEGVTTSDKSNMQQPERESDMFITGSTIRLSTVAFMQSSSVCLSFIQVFICATPVNTYEMLAVFYINLTPIESNNQILIYEYDFP